MINGCTLFDKMPPIGVRAFRLRNRRHHCVLSGFAAFVGWAQVAQHTVPLTDGVALATTPVPLDPRVTPRYLAGNGVDVAFAVSPWQAMGKHDAAAYAGRKRNRSDSVQPGARFPRRIRGIVGFMRICILAQSSIAQRRNQISRSHNGQATHSDGQITHR
jgi:hypothetical protein